MSKRHQSSRRKSYGRRQHELRERSDRQHLPEPLDLLGDDGTPVPSMDPFTFLDPRAPRVRFAMGD